MNGMKVYGIHFFFLLLLYILSQMNLTGTMLNEISQKTQEYILYDFIYIKILENANQPTVTKSRLAVDWGWRWREGTDCKELWENSGMMEVF